MKLRTPDGRLISVNPGIYPVLLEQGYTDPNKLRSADYTLDEAKNMTLSMTPEEIRSFIDGDNRKTAKKWLGERSTDND